MFNEFTEPARWECGSEYFTAGKEVFNNGQIVEIGGNYGIRYAIVKN